MAKLRGGGQNPLLSLHHIPPPTPTSSRWRPPVPRKAVQRTQLSVGGLLASVMTGHHPPNPCCHVVALSRGQNKVLATPAQAHRVELDRKPERGAAGRRPALCNRSVYTMFLTSERHQWSAWEFREGGHCAGSGGPSALPGAARDSPAPGSGPRPRGKKLHESPANFTRCPTSYSSLVRSNVFIGRTKIYNERSC